jgi:Rieske Fe-S protein
MAGEVKFRWSGQVMEPYDKIGYIGRNPADEKNVYIITGDSGNGMTHGTIGGILCTDLILSRKNEWETLYDPRRKTFRPSASMEYAKENLNTAAQFGDWLAKGDVSSVEEISKGSGAVVRRGLRHVAAYRDENGVLHEKSAVCPHLGCIVRWNHVEKTWDCPCHGSRFEAKGKVVNGPALGDLSDPS